MGRFFRIWGPPLLGVAISTAGIMGWVACTLAGRWLLLPVAIVTTFISAGCAFADLVAARPKQRARALDAKPCRGCTDLREQLDASEVDRAELREAIATLQLPEGA